MGNRPNLSTTVFLFFVFVVFPINAFGQITPITAALTGSVYDDFGSVIPNSIVKARGIDKTDRTVRTNDEGVFKINLIGGNYLIEVRAMGFRPFRIEGFRIITSGRENLEIVLDHLMKPGDHSVQVPISKKKKGNKLISNN